MPSLPARTPQKLKTPKTGEAAPKRFDATLLAKVSPFLSVAVQAKFNDIRGSPKDSEMKVGAATGAVTRPGSSAAQSSTTPSRRSRCPARHPACAHRLARR